MVVHYVCLCCNITLHLNEEPDLLAKEVLETDVFSDLTWTHVGRGSLAIAGVAVEQPKLIDCRETDEGWQIWGCKNCVVELFALNNKETTLAFVNLDVTQKPLEEKITESTLAFSSTYKLLIEDDAEAANTLLVCPDEEDKDAYESFKGLQDLLDQRLKDENQEMEDRIQEFIKEQQEAYKEFQTRAYRERKVLWNKICKVNNWDFKKKSIDIDKERIRSNSVEPTKTVYNKSVVIIEDYSVDTGSPPVQKTPISKSPNALNIVETKPVSESPTLHASPTFADFNERHDKPSAIFEMEGEETKDNKSMNLVEVESKEESSSEEEDEDDKEESDYARVVEPAIMMGSSVPVSIPRFEPKTYAPPLRIKDKDVLISASFADQEFSEADLSKSFDVPRSMNRKLRPIV